MQLKASFVTSSVKNSFYILPLYLNTHLHRHTPSLSQLLFLFVIVLAKNSRKGSSSTVLLKSDYRVPAIPLMSRTQRRQKTSQENLFFLRTLWKQKSYLTPQSLTWSVKFLCCCQDKQSTSRDSVDVLQTDHD